MNSIRQITLFACTALAATCTAAPLRVFILAGQSNMQGHANVSTFDYLARDPNTAPLLNQMRDTNGNHTECKRVWISYLSEDNARGATVKEGKLTTGFGARNDTIGPEFTFGITMEKLHPGPILLIKTAWGGKSLAADFRPPSVSADGAGEYYTKMMQHIKTVLSDPKRIVPTYQPSDGVELAGFVWFQGWNDMVNQGAYPNRGKPGGYDAYSDSLAHLIRDVRKELNTPQLPFVIGVLGVEGPTALYESPRYKMVHQSFRDAMAAPAALPEFRGTVAAVLTEKFWDHELATARQKKDRTPEEEEVAKGASNQAFHYLGAAKFFAPLGKEFAETIHALQPAK